MATLEQAREAKQQLLGKLRGKAWLRGVGVGTGEVADAFSVKVNVAARSPEVLKSVPKYLLGVPVVIEVVGMVRARRQTPAVRATGKTRRK